MTISSWSEKEGREAQAADELLTRSPQWNSSPLQHLRLGMTTTQPLSFPQTKSPFRRVSFCQLFKTFETISDFVFCIQSANKYFYSSSELSIVFQNVFCVPFVSAFCHALIELLSRSPDYLSDPAHCPLQLGHHLGFNLLKY